MKNSSKIHPVKRTKYSFFILYLLLFSLQILFLLKKFINIHYRNYDVDSINIDVVYKYINVRDKEINRNGLKQMNKDYDNDELRYSLRSVITNIEWVRKIFVIMPNNNIWFINKSKDFDSKIVYIKDNELLGFDSSSSITFEHNALYKLDVYNVSEYFIYFCDDYFINKKLRKKDFYYYSKKEGRIIPYIMNYGVKLSDKVYDKYNSYYIKNKLKLNKDCEQTYKDYWFQTSLAYLLLYKHFNTTSLFLPHSFDENWHNCIPLTISDLKEIHKMEEEDYEYKEELFNSIYRTNKQITFESVYFYYFFNKYKRERGSLKGRNINVKNVKKELWKDCDVFCINTGPEKINEKYKLIEKRKLSELFPKSNYFEL